MKVDFFMKVSGSGNDFIIVDNRDGQKRPSPFYIKKLCSPKTGIGADGLILLEKGIKNCDFKMVYFNNDGKEAEMCGNGGRSIVLFAYLMRIIKKRKVLFCSKNGVHQAQIKKGNIVKLELSPPHSLKQNIKVETRYGIFTGSFINTGVPHFVIEVDDIESIDVRNIGREIRFSKVFKKEGTNVNFVKREKKFIKIRTYERGVEDETLSCGTGSVASAIIMSLRYNISSPVKILARSGEFLTIYFDENYSKVFLEGKVTPIFIGYNLL
ncbi:MAG: diaminopimelate epimerase [candidate division WOR-3 bacterium]